MKRIINNLLKFYLLFINYFIIQNFPIFLLIYTVRRGITKPKQIIDFSYTLMVMYKPGNVNYSAS